MSSRSAGLKRIVREIVAGVGLLLYDIAGHCNLFNSLRQYDIV